jgi:hypothetical protein
MGNGHPAYYQSDWVGGELLDALRDPLELTPR